MKIGLWIIAASMLLVVLEALASYFLSHNFWPSQVMTRWGKAGIAFFTHGGMWGDLFILPLVMATVIVKYGDSWEMRQIAIMAMVGVTITLANHLMLIYTQTIPDPLGWQREKWSTVIALHFIYMSVYVALIGLFFIHSPGVSVTAAVGVAVALGVHVALGTHVTLGLLNLWYRWGSCPDFLASPILPYLTTAVWLILAVLASVAAGLRAGFAVVTIGAGLTALVMCIIRLAPR